jgi:hypothetical protein
MIIEIDMADIVKLSNTQDPHPMLSSLCKGGNEIHRSQ